MCPMNFLALFDLAVGWRFDQICVSELWEYVLVFMFFTFSFNIENLQGFVY